MEKYFYFFNEHWVLTLLFIILLIANIANELYIYKNSKKFISVNKAIDLMNHNNAKIFDIRDKKQYNDGYIKNSLCINLLDKNKNEYLIRKYKKQCIIICGDNNHTAKKHMNMLYEKGISEIYILKDGVQSWLKAELPLSKKIK